MAPHQRRFAFFLLRLHGCWESSPGDWQFFISQSPASDVTGPSLQSFTLAPSDTVKNSS
jgi:hypothetical protein